MRKRTKRRLLLAAVITMVVLTAAAVVCQLQYTRWHSTYITICGESVRRDSTSLDLSGQLAPDLNSVAQLTGLQSLDLTDTGISIDQYLHLQDALPGCAITWSVPFQGGYVPCHTTELTLTSLTLTDVERLVYFPQLAAVDATACTDLAPILTLRKTYPQLEVAYKVPVSGAKYDPDITQLALTWVDPAEFSAALPHLQQLKDVVFTGQIPTNPQICLWKAAYPNVRFIWEFELCGKTVSSLDTQLDLNKVKLTSIDEVYAAIPCFYNMEKVEMCDCGIPSEEMGKLVKAYPNTKFVWIIQIGRTRLRTDITTFMPYKLGFGSGTFDDRHTKELKYCTDIIAMDLGHMPVSDLSFLADMTNMQYLILAECTATDFSVLRNLKELKYLELFLTSFDDAKILADLPKLEDVNLCYTHISDIRPLVTMTNLKTLWMSGLYRTTWGERQYVKEKLTNTKVEFNTYGSTEGGWRQIPNYFAQRDLFGMGYMTG